jgi:hypothetical protein
LLGAIALSLLGRFGRCRFLLRGCGGYAQNRVLQRLGGGEAQPRARRNLDLFAGGRITRFGICEAASEARGSTAETAYSCIQEEIDKSGATSKGKRRPEMEFIQKVYAENVLIIVMRCGMCP